LLQTKDNQESIMSDDEEIPKVEENNEGEEEEEVTDLSNR
jgi:hypothetical protein